MGLTNENVGPKILAKIKIYVLTRAELLFKVCYEIPCIKCHYLEGWHGNNLFRNPYKGDKRFGYSDSFQLLDDEAIGYIRNLTKVITE